MIHCIDYSIENFKNYPSFEHFFFIKSNSFMATPHLSGVVCFGQTVTDGKVSSSIGYVMVSNSKVMVGLSYQTEKYQANFNSTGAEMENHGKFI